MENHSGAFGGFNFLVLTFRGAFLSPELFGLSV